MKKIWTVLVVVLAAIGVFFIALLVWPDGGEETTEDVAGAAVIKEGASNVNIPESELSKDTLSFTTTDLDGNAVTQDIFADYDITVVHVWGTFCGPCIEEMGEYAQLYKDIPENVNIIGMVIDVYEGSDENVESAKEILGNAGAEFTNLRTSDSVYEYTKKFTFVPSSFFVDREGHIIGKTLNGAPYSATIERLNKYLD